MAAVIGNYEAIIEIDGRPAPLYDPPKDERDDECRKPWACCKYIEASAGKQFKVKLITSSLTPFPTGRKVMDLNVDGTSIPGATVNQHKSVAGLPQETTSDGAIQNENGNWVKRPFQFKDLSTVDEIPKDNDIRQIAKHIGTIGVRIYDIEQGASRPRMSHHGHPAAPIPEKALKGQPIDLSIGYGKAIPLPPQTTRETTRIRPSLARFTFKYRSRKALQMLDILPATPEAASLEDRDPDTLDLQEACLSLTQYRSRENVKQENENIKVEATEREVSSESATQEHTKRTRPISLHVDNDDCQIVEVKKCKVKEKEIEVFDLT